MNRNLYLSATLAGALLLGACSEKKVAADVKPAATPVEPYRVAMLPFEDEITYSAMTEPVAQVELAFRTGGEVSSLYLNGGRPLEAGDTVPAGAVLASLRVTEYQARLRSAEAQVGDMLAAKGSAEAQVLEARAAVTQADADLRRGEALFAAQAMTRAELDSVRARAEGARARLEAARRNVEGFEARINAARAVRDESAVPLGDTRLVAPFAAVVVARRVEKGSTVGAGTVAYVLADMRQLKVNFGVPDVALSRFGVGTAVKVRFEALDGQTFTSRVTSVAPVADGATRLFRVQGIINNPGIQVKAGMVGNVALENAPRKNMPAVPLRAVRRGEAGSFAVMAIEKQRLVERTVTLGATQGSMVAIAKGLAEGELIVADGAPRLKAGDEVRY
jgi:RND family efflux transporter MFP subunit